MASSSQGPFNFAHDQSDKYKWKNELPLGVRFRPTDEELLRDYLELRIWNLATEAGIIKDANIYEYPPELLPKIAYGHDDGRMYFFTYLEKKDNSMTRARRGVGEVGFWKATQAQTTITKNHEELGTKTPLSYYKYVLDQNGNRVCTKQNWLMQEYRLPRNCKQGITKTILDIMNWADALRLTMADQRRKISERWRVWLWHEQRPKKKNRSGSMTPKVVEY